MTAKKTHQKREWERGRGRKRLWWAQRGAATTKFFFACGQGRTRQDEPIKSRTKSWKTLPKIKRTRYESQQGGSQSVCLCLVWCVLLLFLLQGIRIRDIIIFFIKVSNNDKNYNKSKAPSAIIQATIWNRMCACVSAYLSMCVCVCVCGRAALTLLLSPSHSPLPAVAILQLLSTFFIS